MLNIVVGSTILSTMIVGFIYACILAQYQTAKIKEYAYETLCMCTNAIVGMLGFGLYMTYLPVIGRLQLSSSIANTLSCDDTNCRADVVLINTYTALSTLRFLCWYTEFVISYCFIMFMARSARVMTCLRYCIHALNVSLSAGTFILAAFPIFPRQFVLGGETTSPVVQQGILLMWAILSFWFISRSRLYRQHCCQVRFLQTRT